MCRRVHELENRYVFYRSPRSSFACGVQVVNAGVLPLTDTLDIVWLGVDRASGVFAAFATDNKSYSGVENLEACFIH